MMQVVRWLQNKTDRQKDVLTPGGVANLVSDRVCRFTYR
jgi:hypothetical protein